MRIDALMATLDAQMPTEAISSAGSAGNGDNSFSDMLESIQSGGPDQTETTVASTTTAGENPLPLTDLLKMMGQYTGETEAASTEVGDLLLSSTTERVIPLTEAMAALSTLR